MTSRTLVTSLLGAAVFLTASPILAQQRSVVPEPPQGWTYGGPAAPAPAYISRGVSTGVGVLGVIAITKTAATAGYVTAGTAVVMADQFAYPKFKPDGSTIRGHWLTSDFNSPPRIPQYRNVLPPLPATHPPITEPGVLFGDQRLSTEAAGSIRIEY